MHLDLRIFSGTAHPELADEIAQYLGVRRSDATVKHFPDGETFVKINENIRKRDIFIVQPTCPPTNQNLMELLIMVDAAKRASAESITAVIPFFGYARQDRKDQPRVPITAKLVANLLTAAGVTRVLTIDLHAGQIQGFFDIPVDHLYAMPVLIKYLRDKGVSDNLVVVSPDVGGMKMAHAYSKALGTPLAIVAKKPRQRHRGRGDQPDRRGRGQGRPPRRRHLRDRRHPHLGGEAPPPERGQTHLRGRLPRRPRRPGAPAHRRVGDRGAHFTNSTPYATGEKVKTVSVAEILGEAIRRIHFGESVTSLFDIS